jgi:hypothetical protein
MDHRVERLRTPAECAIFARNAVDKKRPDLALEAHRKAVDLQVATHEAASPLEAEGLATVYAHEALLTHQNDGKKRRATTTWQAVKRYGIIEAIQKAVNRRTATESCTALRELGLQDLAFEAFVLRHEDSFNAAAVKVSKERLAVPAV